MTAKIILFIFLILPWFTLFFASSTTIKRFMPVTVFTCFLMTIIFQIAYIYNWWVIEAYIVPWGYMTDVSFAYGIFAVGTFWIFRLTSHNFLWYTVINLIMDIVMSFIILPLLSLLGVAKYKNITFWQYALVIYGLSFVIYFYHKWQKKIFSTD
ncbi:hypothetical protein SFC65_25140 [Priestia filamentosa]|uniref:hypothetical protein n=2 Tax=Priestia filamentosa TaxID=1402861 RepID=UPI003982AF5C